MQGLREGLRRQARDVLDVELRALVVREFDFRVDDLGFRIQGSGFRVHTLGVEELGFVIYLRIRVCNRN